MKKEIPIFDIVTIGSNTVDVFVDTDKENSDIISIKTSTSLKELLSYPLGTKILINDLNFTIGGGGTNTALAISKLGLSTAYLGVIGSDNNSKMILDFLNSNNIKFIGEQIKGKSGYSVILDSFENDRTIFTYKGVNDKLMFSKIPDFKTKAIYASSMMGKSFNTLKKIFLNKKKYAFEKNKLMLVFNPSSYTLKEGLSSLKEILSCCDVLIFNLEEACLLLEKEFLRDKKYVKQLLLELQKYVSNVIITDGKHGVYAYYDNNYLFLNAHGVKVKETTGAGDSFGSTFLSIYLKQNNFKEALKFALCNAESVIQEKGAKNGLCNLKELTKKVKNSEFKFEEL